MIIVVDIGSSSTRASIYDDQADAVSNLSTRAPVEFTVGEDGRHEDDADAAFRRIVTLFDDLHARLTAHGPADARPRALGVSCYASSLVCLDEHGAPLTPVYTYGDTRSADDARRLRAEHDELDALQRTGCRIRSNYLPSKIAWIERAHPEVFARTRWFASLSDYIHLRLCGRMSAGISIASWSGLLSRATSDWDKAWLTALGVANERMPPIAASPVEIDCGSGQASLASEWAGRWPLFKDAICRPAVGDGAAANIGSGCIDPSRIAVTIGTTAAMRVVRPHSADSPVPAALWAYRVDHAHDLIGGATTEGGNVFGWARKILRVPDPDSVEQALSLLAPDAHGLTVLPTFAGERSPGYAEDIRATLHGLSLDTSPIEIMRALMEGIALRLATICDALRDSGVASQDARLEASGGALLASPTWRQIIADACGLTLHVADVPEATSRGVAVLAAVSGAQSSNAAVQSPISYHPDNHRHAIYRAAMARQQELYAKLVRSDG